MYYHSCTLTTLAPGCDGSVYTSHCDGSLSPSNAALAAVLALVATGHGTGSTENYRRREGVV